MMIQSAILAGCTGGHKAKNSTAALRAKNAAAKSAANQNAGTPVVVENKTDTNTGSGQTATPDTSKNNSATTKGNPDAPVGSAVVVAPVIKDAPAAGKDAAGTAITSGTATVPKVENKPVDSSATPVVTVETTAKTEAKVEKPVAQEAAPEAKVEKPAAPEAAPAKAAEATNSIDKRKGKLAAGSLYLDDKGNKVDQSDKPCSVDVVEKGSNLALDIKMGDFEQYQPIKKNDLDNHFIKLEKIKEPIAFDYFTNKPVSIVMVMMASFDNKEKQEAGVAISRSYFVFNGDKIKTKDEAEKAMEPTAEKIINEKDYKEADYVQDIYAFLVKDNKIAAVKYQNRRAISGTAAKSSAKNLSGSEFKNEAKMICVFTD